ncbi:hypothetical protein RB653_003159 [Dictyostelium firmibasis]|uniref:Uracil permease n=1 Tax=Dictyostelium firmibasis TaxID=79012 RepID=A0AAN7YQM9_9MYCE
MNWENIKIMISDYFPKYKLKETNMIPIMPDERIPLIPTFFLSFQHILAMFGGNILCPLLMGFSTNSSLFFSGIGTLIFYVCTGGKVPSYLGASFAFIGVINSATGFVYSPGAVNPNIAPAAGGILVCGFIYLAIALIVMVAGHKWIEFLTPPVVTGSVIVSIGLHLASSAVGQAAATGFDAWMAAFTVLIVVMVTCYAPGPLKRLPILIGGVVAYIVYLLFGLKGIGPGIDFSAVSSAKWVGLPPTHFPEFDSSYISMIAPVAVILAAENIGHLKAVGSMTENSMDHLLGRTFLGDALACILAGFFGSTGTTTYAENIGVMSITKIFSTLSFVFAASIAIALGCLPMFGAIVQTIPSGIFGGLSIVLFGITAVTGAKLWVNAQVDFSKPRNLLTAGISIVLGTGMLSINIEWGQIKIDAIGVATFSSIFLYQLLRDNWGTIFRNILAKITGRSFKQQGDEETVESPQYSNLLVPLIENEGINSSDYTDYTEYKEFKDNDEEILQE